MKNLVKIYQLILLLYSIQLTSQNQFIVCPSFTATAAASAAQPTSCNRLLADLTPFDVTNDAILEVNVNFWVFVPATSMSSLASIWTNSLDPSTSADAISALNFASNKLATMPYSPKLAVPGVTAGVTNSKIKFKLKGFNYVHDDVAYNDTPAIGLIAASPSNTAWFDPNAINIFVGGRTSATLTNGPNGPSYYVGASILARTVTATGTNNVVELAPSYYYTLTPTYLYDNVRNYGNELAHEFCHILGLFHTTDHFVNNGPGSGEPSSFITPTYGCCTHIKVEDVYPEVYQSFNSIQQIGCNTPGGSDNLMSQNSGCNRYLSPNQVAIMHYNLRTIFTQFLTPNGYTAATTMSGLFNYDVVANETWDNGDRYMKGNVRVKAGKTLTIKCGVAMTKGARIIVENGAQLIIDGGHVTNISGRTWRGIEVMGNPLLSQNTTHPSNPGALLNQGIVRVKNFGKISHADIGIANHLGNGNFGGGVVITDRAIFENNVKDIDFQIANSYVNPLASISKFVRSTFITNAAVGELSQFPLTHVYLKNTKGVQFLGCTFQYVTSPTNNGPKGDGITSIDAVYHVSDYTTGSAYYPSIFENLYRGIYVNNVNPLKVPTIIKTVFKEPAAYGAYFLNTNYLSFKTNTVQYGNFYGMAGVYLNNCKYYKISNNVFVEPLNLTTQDQGLNIYQSKFGSHEVYANVFSNIMTGINCMDDNSGVNNFNDGLRMNCNIFNQVPNLYDIALTYTNGLAPPTVMTTQGEVFVQTAFNVARNIYGASCGNENKWYIHNSSTKPIDHGANTNSVNAVTQPTPQPSCSSNLINIVNSNISLDYPNHCPVNPPSSGGSSTVQSLRMANLNTYISDLKSMSLNNEHHFEIQSSVASKLYEFLSDTIVDDIDSVVTILYTNQGNMQDADIQLIFAYLAKDDYAAALVRVNELTGTKMDWKHYFMNLIDLKQTVNGDSLLCENTESFNFFADYADTYDKDGQASAQALLKSTCNRDYTEPHAFPEGFVRGRFFNPDQYNETETNLEKKQNVWNDNVDFKVYPNPTNGSFTLQYKATTNSALTYKICDILGKCVKSGNLKTNSAQEIDTDLLGNGIYFITLLSEHKVLSKQKIVVMK